MNVVVRACVAALAGLLAACVSAPTPYSQQEERARALTPDNASTTSAAAEGDGKIRPVLVRVFLDEDFRSQERDAVARVNTAFENANGYMTDELGLAFEVVDVVNWARRGADLEIALKELRARGGAEGVDLVVGFVTSTPQWTASFHDLGRAELLGKYAVVRGSNDLAEKRHLDKSLDLLGATRREEVYRQRRDHKEAALLIHEWAHTVGGLHVEDPESFLHPFHDLRVRRFSALATTVVIAGYDWHRAPSSNVREHSGERLVAALEALPTPDRDKAVKDGLLTFIRGVSAARPAFDGGASADAGAGSTNVAVLPSRPTVPLTEFGRTRLNAANDALNRGAFEEAAEAVGPLARRHTSDAFIQRTACLASQQQSLMAAKRGAACRRCQHEVPQDAVCVLIEARLVTEEGDEQEVGRLLAEARRRLAEASPPSPGEWVNVASLFRGLRSLSDAEAAAAHAPDDTDAQRILAWVKQSRLRFGLPGPSQPGAVSVADERGYLLLVDAVYEAIGDRRDDEAASQLLDGIERFGEAPGLLALQCEVLGRQRRWPDARQRCARSLELFEASVIGHTTTAVLDAQTGNLQDAVGHARRALELDPSHEPSWRLLGKLYRHGKRHDDLAALRRAFRDTFDRDLVLE